MRRLLIAAMMLVMLMAPRMASAQAQKGDSEMLLQGLVFTSISSVPTTTISGTHVTTTTSTQTSTTGLGVFNLGVFLSDSFELGGGPSISVSGGFGSTTVSVGANGFLRKYFSGKNPKLPLFVGLELQERDFSDFSNQLFANALVGLKDYVSPRAALEFSESFGVNPSDPGSNQLLTFKVGLTVLFGK